MIGPSIIVTDRQSVERGFLVRSSYALISIRDLSTRRARVPKTTALRETLHLAFSDAEPTKTMRIPPKIKLFTVAQARQIWRFVNRHKKHVGAFVVHCHQGMSRSPAVAAALATYLGQDGRKFWRRYMPNKHVHQLLCDTMPRGSGAGDSEDADWGAAIAPDSRRAWESVEQQITEFTAKPPRARRKRQMRD